MCDNGSENDRTRSDSVQSVPLDESGETRLPIVELLTGRGFITGKSGSGKSNSASVIAEELLDRGFPILIVDTDGEYWGLKEEYEILHVGADEECDLQVGDEHAGKLAELALDEHVPIILDVSGYLDEADANAMVRETARELFTAEKKRNQPFLMLVEEIHEYLPEGGGTDETGEMLTRVAKRGRKRGLGICGLSQRPADVKKDFITQCDWLCWHRLTWDNDTKVVRRVIDADHADAVQDLADGEAFLMADFLDVDVQRVQVRRKRTFDAGATPDLSDAQRPELKSVGGDLVAELEQISEEEQRRQDRIAQLESELEKKQETVDELRDELENARDMSEMAEQFTQAMLQQGGDGDAASEKVEELIEERNRLQSLVGDLRSENSDLEERIGELEQQLEQRPQISERAVEAVDVLADEFGVADADTEALRRKLQAARDKIDELESKQPTDTQLETDPFDNRKVQSVVSDVRAHLSDLDDKERQMLRYFLVNGPASQKEAYKYAGGSPTSGTKSKKTRTLVDAGLVTKEGRGQYDFGLKEYLRDALSGFEDEEIEAVARTLEEDVYDLVMEGGGDA